MPLTPQTVLRTFILLALNELGGSATKARVLESVGDGLFEPYVAGRATRGAWTLTTRGRKEASRLACV